MWVPAMNTAVPKQAYCLSMISLLSETGVLFTSPLRSTTVNKEFQVPRVVADPVNHP